MLKKLFSAALCTCTGFLLYAQIETLPSETQKEWLSVYQAELAKAGPMQLHLKSLSGKEDKLKINAARVAKDFENIRSTGLVRHYAVDPMGETQYLPDVYPFDGKAGAPVRIVSAQDEYEPGSFILYPLKNLGKVAFEVSELKAKDGATIRKADLDLKVVKVWYQCGNGWYSYFNDTGLKLCPELLLNDEDLIKVDTKKVANYARLTDKNGKVSYQILTVPQKMNFEFACMVPEFQDATVFKGATLNEGEFKQFVLTAHVKKDQKPGLYHGAVTLKQGNGVIARIPVELRVLPFSLPAPMCYQDPDKKFRDFMSGYINLPRIRLWNGNDPELAKKQLMAILHNLVAHNEVMPNYWEATTHPEYGREAGMDMSTFIVGDMILSNPADMRFDARRKAEMLKRTFGTHRDHFLDWNDEFGYKLLCAVRPMIDIYQDHGLRYACNSPGTYVFGMYFTDFYRIPITPDFEFNRLAEKIGTLGKDLYFGWYAVQHVGVENPAFCRRQYGLGPYRAGFSCNRNYAHHLNGYNDRGGWFKSMNLFIGDGKGVIDTIAWEGYREGIDDIRYATLIQHLARPMLNSENYKAKYAARKAMQYLADMNSDDFDLSTARLEMIRHVLALQQFSKTGDKK